MYTIDDGVIVRKTPIFPKDGIVQIPVHGRAYDFSNSLYLGDALNEIINSLFSSLEAGTEERKKYAVYYETFRSTLHYVTNGVVKDSIFGIFKYPIAIIDLFKYHKDSESLVRMRPEDIVFNDDMKLSPESVVLIPKDKEEEYREKYGFAGLNIRTYTGSLDYAIKDYFKEMNYPFFDVNNHGYRDGLDNESDAFKMLMVLRDFAESRSISLDRHINSDINFSDGQKRYEKSKETDYRHLVYILDSGLVSSDLVEKIKSVIPFDLDNFTLKSKFKPLALELIKQIGLSNLQKLTEEFNNIMLKEREESIEANVR